MPLPCRPGDFHKRKHDGLQLLARGSAAGLLQLCLLHSEMVLVSESRRTNSLNFRNERKVLHLHDKGLSAPKIRLKVKNLEGGRPSQQLVDTTIKQFSCRGFGGRKFRYDRCGRKAWKMTPEVKKFLIQKLSASMRKFQRGSHDAIILDDVRDCMFFVKHQEKLQGKYDYMVEFASTPGGKCAYERDLFAIPIVATINNTTKNRHLLESDDWLSNPGNRVFLSWPVDPSA